MIDLILVIIFCYQLNKIAGEKGVSSLSYILNYIVLFMIMMFLLVNGIIYFYGPDVFKNEQGIKTAVMFEPIAISFEVLLFLLFKRRIEKTEVHDEDENETPHPSTPEKKDLSYFR